MNQRIFLVEDDPDIALLVRHHLEGAGYVLRAFPSMAGVVAAAMKGRPALFLLDIMLPGGSGLSLCEEIRRSQTLAATPVIFVTAKTSEADRVLGFEVGADDYITKPFSPRELVARVRAVLRRFEVPLAAGIREFGDVRIDSGAMTLTVRGNVVSTTATEFRLLDYFVSHIGRVLARDELLDAVWRDTTFITPRSIDVYVRRLRMLIEDDPNEPRYLKTVRGAGYRFDAPQ